MTTDHGLSAGAARVLASAGRRAASEGASEVAVNHLMQALWSDESRAADRLAAAGCTDADIAHRFGATADDLNASGLDDLAPEVADTLLLARRLAKRDPEGPEIGTIHLLQALNETDASTHEWLSQWRIDWQPERGAAAETIATEPLAWDGGAKLRRSIDARPDRDLTRLLDAAANRCREGLRVVEDYVRYVRDDAPLSLAFKEFRHDLASALAPLGADRFYVARDTPGDVGTGLGTSAEYTRHSPADAVRANLSRVLEALRSLEEYGKVMSAQSAADIEALRYRAYTLEKSVLMLLDDRSSETTGQLISQERTANLSPLYLLVTEALCVTGIERVVCESVAGGVGIVQLREKNRPDRELLALARNVREWSHAGGALFIMNDRPDLARLSDADGVHLGQDDVTVAEARAILGPSALIGVSTHNIDQARQAVAEGADYIGIGPTFASRTKQFAAFAGLDFVRQVRQEITLPAYAIGGISADTLPELLRAGGRQIAVSHAICAARDPHAAAAALRTQLEQVTPP